MSYTPPPLFIADKQQTATNAQRLPVAFRAIERYLGNLHIPTGGGGGGYLSLTGPGQTTTPGDLTQAGGFEVDALTSAIQLQAGNTVTGGGILIENVSPTSGTAIIDESTNGLLIETQRGDMQIQNIGPGVMNIAGGGSGGGVGIGDVSTNGVTITTVSGPGGIQILSRASPIVIDPGTGQRLILRNLPTTSPGVTGAVWRNGTVLNIV